jgi:N-acetylglutamate synthase
MTNSPAFAQTLSPTLVAGAATLDLAEVQACEERIVNCWPALHTLLMGDWVVRLANGYSGRANSASPLRPGAILGNPELGAIEAIYRAHQRPAIFRLSPLADVAVTALLLERGYRLMVCSMGMLGPLPHSLYAHDPAICVTSAPTLAWIKGVCALQAQGKRDTATFGAMMNLLAVPAGFFEISVDGVAVGYGLGTVDRGYLEISSVILAEASRGLGLGRRLVAAMCQWGDAHGAERAFLQVDRTNERARALYRSLGMRDLYQYDQYEKAL